MREELVEVHVAHRTRVPVARLEHRPARHEQRVHRFALWRVAVHSDREAQLRPVEAQVQVQVRGERALVSEHEPTGRGQHVQRRDAVRVAGRLVAVVVARGELRFREHREGRFGVRRQEAVLELGSRRQGCVPSGMKGSRLKKSNSSGLEK